MHRRLAAGVAQDREAFMHDAREDLFEQVHGQIIFASMAAVETVGAGEVAPVRQLDDDFVAHQFTQPFSSCETEVGFWYTLLPSKSA